jgi:hypothetical protein
VERGKKERKRIRRRRKGEEEGEGRNEHPLATNANPPVRIVEGFTLIVCIER